MAAKITKMRAITAVVVLGAAAGSGYFMQPGAPVAQNALIAEQSNLTAPVLPAESEAVTRSANQPSLTLASANPETPQIAEITVLAPTTSECEAGFTANAAPGAMVDLTLEAPCYAGQSVDIFHAGLRFSEQMNDAGMMQITLPAMEEDAFFNALFSDGHTESTDILMLTVEDYVRVALTWQGQTGFALYALENGAAYGDTGHVSRETPFDYTRAISGEGGFLTELGQGATAYQAVIYSYPIAQALIGNQPEISVEAEVLANTCNTEISATLLRNSELGALDSSSLFMAVPGCDAVGEFLVLKNLPQNLRIASN